MPIVISRPRSVKWSSKKTMQEASDIESQQARNYVTRLLARFPQTRAGLATKLRRREYSASVIDEILEWAEALGYLDELRLAETTRDKYRKRGYGPLWISQKLRQMGVQSSHIAQVMNQQKNTDDTEGNDDDLLVLAQRMLKAIPLERTDRLGIVARRLASRGYPAEEIYKIFQQIDGSCVDIDCE